MQVLRAFTTAPAWAAHFHADGPDGRSVACFDARCGVAPLATSEAAPFAPAPPCGGMPVPASAPARQGVKVPPEILVANSASAARSQARAWPCRWPLPVGG